MAPRTMALSARRWRARAISGLIGLCLVFGASPAALAATATNSWLAKLGTAGANGTVTVNAFTTGTGNIVLKLKKLKASTAFAVVLLKTSCKGASLATLASVKSSSTGVVTKTTNLTAAQVSAVKKQTAGTGKFAIRVGTGTTAKCAVFAAQPVPAYIVGTVSVGQSPSGAAIDTTGVWVTNWWENTLSRINPANNQVVAEVSLLVPDLEGPEAIAVGGGSLWVTTTEVDTNDDPLPGHVLRVDPATGAILATIPIGRGSYAIAYGASAVWLTNHGDGNVMRIDPVTNTVVATIPVVDALGVAVDATSVWVAGLGGIVTRIDPATNAVVTSVPTQLTGFYIAIGGGSIWVTNPGTSGAGNGSVSRIDPATNLVISNIVVGDNPSEIRYAGGYVWVGLEGLEAAVIRINPATNKVMSRTAVVSKVYAVAAVDHAVWAVHKLPVPAGVTEPPDGVVTRIGF